MKLLKYNINKLFPFLSLRTKLIIAFALLSAIPLIIVGVLGINSSVDKMREIALDNLSHDVTMYNERAQNFISNVDIDIKYLVSNKNFHEYIEAANKEEKSSLIESKLKRVQELLINFGISHNIYFQYRYVDANADEKFHIQFYDNRFKLFDKENLNENGLGFYFNLTEKSTYNQNSMIPAELLSDSLNTIPAISFALRIYDSEKKFAGIFIADIFAKELFKVLEQKAHIDYGKEIAIINNEGHYLYHSEKKKNWNKLLAYQGKNDVSTRYSSGLIANILSGKSGIIADDPNEIIAYAPLFFSTFTGGSKYYIFESVNQLYIIEPAKKFAIIALLFIVLFLIVSITFGIIATNQIARPIHNLRKGAEIIAAGNYSYRLNIQTNDEIEQLSSQFNSMAAALGERENLLTKHKENLERVVVERTKELKSEKEKLQAILDNVPSAFILMDDNCVILSASKAISNFSIFFPEQLIGKKCSAAFGNEYICKNCPLINSVRTKEVYSFIENKISKTGKERYIEHISIPITIDKNKGTVLEILTDITERKKTVEHIIKLQKLVTIGETSAFLAHEMRNSLTSIKMFLQLQLEASNNEEEKESLIFSLGSINKMEKVVNDLLSLGNRTKINLSSVNINTLIMDSIAFIKPQFENDGINIKLSLDVNIPSSMLDAGQIKEAIMNLLINSKQAIESNGIINISTKIVTLDYDLVDFAYIDSIPTNQYDEDYKITLKKGTKVICLEVADNGKGISDLNFNKIFDPFFTTKENGTGLGLTMVKRTINNHNGLVEVKSELNMGTNIKLLFPIKDKI